MKFRMISMLFIPFVSANADTFGDGAFTMDFVTIGDVDNVGIYDALPMPRKGVGSVGYYYRMGVHEVSRGMIEAYNSLSGGPTLTMNNLSSMGGNGANRPATGLSWNEAARFVNWLNTSQGYSPAYKFTTDGYNDNIEVWTPQDDGYDEANRFRNAKAHYFLPDVDEWIKAAYYDPEADGALVGYWKYAIGSDTAPSPVANGTGSDTAVYGQAKDAGPADITDAGGLSAYGTMAQGGNVSEWLESVTVTNHDRSVGDPTAARVLAGGGWATPYYHLDSRSGGSAAVATEGYGFRVAATVSASE